MANSNVRFFFGSLSKYLALATKDPMALYFVTNEETGKVYLYKGDQLYASDAIASSIADGWMSKEDKIALDELIASGGAVANLQPVDGSIVITDNKIGVAISAEAGNIIVKKNDGLYVDASGSIDVPSYSIEKQATAEDGYSATYKLTKTVGNETSYVGDAINIPKDMVLQSATLETVVETNVPYDGAVIGDPYIKMTFNDADGSSIFVPVKGLVDTVNAGQGISVVDNTVSVKLSPVEGNILSIAADGGLFASVPECTFTPVEKAQLAAIPMVYATKEEVDDKIARAIESNQMVWEELDSVIGVARIGNEYYATIPAALSAAKAGDTINLMAGTYNMVEFTKATASNLTVVGGEGVYIKKIRLMDTTNYSAPNNLTLKNITFNGEGIAATDDDINNLSVIGCTFIDGAVIHIGSCNTDGLLIKDCKFTATNSAVNTKEKTAILVQGTSKNVVIIDNNIADSEFNAIQIINASGAVTIDGNVINNTGSRAMRITTKDGTVLVITDNTISNVNTDPAEALENNGEIIKVTGAVIDGSLTGNTCDGNNIVFTDGLGKIL